MFDKEISHYNVVVFDNVNGIYRHFETVKKFTEEEAVKYAREKINDKNIRYKVRIEQVSYLVDWME